MINPYVVNVHRDWSMSLAYDKKLRENKALQKRGQQLLKTLIWNQRLKTINE